MSNFSKVGTFMKTFGQDVKTKPSFSTDKINKLRIDLIKDNHIASSDLKTLVIKAIKNKKGKKITVEVDTVDQLKSILGLKFNAVLLDNMNIKNLRNAVKIAKKYYETEASGNVNLKTVKAIASTGVNRISIGSITHSATAVDFKLEI